MKDTKFKPGESGNRAGRPPGKTAGAKIRAAIEKRKDEILQAVIDAAIAGDMQACKMLLDRITPPLKPVAAQIALPVPDGAGLAEQGAEIIRATLGRADSARHRQPTDNSAGESGQDCRN